MLTTLKKRGALREAAPALMRDVIQLSLVQRKKQKTVPLNRAETADATAPPKLWPTALMRTFPVVAMLDFGVT